ncbi:DUF2975 domain-containing protein [Lentilitoribacter sp. EG35]|jgi:uncharacterized membrane protein|uniref:DUF2975 domain-containing protein n=1 Tax=Lentilitoribacter sp. EG35 TaxID=3234192 RepID=UPI003460C1E1
MPEQNRTSQAYDRIKNISVYAEVFSGVGIFITVGAMTYYLILMIVDIALFDAAIRDEYATDTMNITINYFSRISAFIFGIIPMLIGVFFFDQARRLFHQYKSKRVFTHDAAARLNRMGWALVALAPVGVLVKTFTILALTLYNGPGDKHLAFGISENEVYAIILGLLLITLAKILHEAAIISDENQAFV